MNAVPTGALTSIIEDLDNRLHDMRRFANEGPHENERGNISEERAEVYRRLERNIERCDRDLIELEQILALVIEYNEAHKDEQN